MRFSCSVDGCGSSVKVSLIFVRSSSSSSSRLRLRIEVAADPSKSFVGQDFGELSQGAVPILENDLARRVCGQVLGVFVPKGLHEGRIRLLTRLTPPLRDFSTIAPERTNPLS